MKAKICYFCQNNLTISHTDAKILRDFITGQGKILNHRRTGTCARHQKQLSKAIKRARILGLLPFTTK